jgi:hypothetical protein
LSQGDIDGVRGIAEIDGLRTYLTSLVLTVFFAACSSNGDGVTANDGAAGMVGADGGPGGSGGTGAVTYQDVKPIFAAKCVPCHVTGGEGAPFHTLAESYATANDPSGLCPGKKKGECTLVQVKSGYMPFMKKCTGDPTKDGGNSACLTAEEQQKLADWIAGGLREK